MQGHPLFDTEGGMNAEHQENKAPDAHAPESKGEAPRRWWQWLLIYPGLAIAILGAVPTYMEAFKSYSLGVPFGRSFDAREQNRLWQENFECVQTATFSTITNKKKVEIGSKVCESGDVLLRGKRAEWDQPQLRWVSWSELAPSDDKKRGALLDIFASAYADAEDRTLLAQAPVSVLCQRWVRPGQLLQRIGTPTGCFDQLINTYNGWVLSSRRAPCAPNC
jgi:hypothetical protein